MQGRRFPVLVGMLMHTWLHADASAACFPAKMDDFTNQFCGVNAEVGWG
jgi:hypothetical protein